MRIFLRSRTFRIDYWWYEIAVDGAVIPFEQPFFPFARRYLHLVPEGHRSAILVRDDTRESPYGLFLVRMPTGTQDLALRPINVDLLIECDKPEDTLAVARRFIRIWPLTPELLPELFQHAAASVAAGVELLEWKRWRESDPEAELKPEPDIKEAGMALRGFIEDAVKFEVTDAQLPAEAGSAARERPDGRRLLASAATERINDVLSWVKLDRVGAEVLIISPPRDAQVVKTQAPWDTIEYVLRADGPAEWTVLPKQVPVMAAVLPSRGSNHAEQKQRTLWAPFHAIVQLPMTLICGAFRAADRVVQPFRGDRHRDQWH